ERVLDAASTRNIQIKQFDIMQYEWGAAHERRVLLVHGWEGQAGNFAALIHPLLEMDYRILAFDAPAHGRSSKEHKTNMFEFIDFLAQQVRQFNPDVIISHSFGSVQTASIFRKYPDLSVSKWFAITTPFAFQDYINGVTQFFGISKQVERKLIQRLERQLGESMHDATMQNYAKTLQNIGDILIAHSKSDKILNIEGARKTHQAFKQSRLVELNNMGHYRILWSDEILELLGNYLAPTVTTE
ncbi:MAG: alpha/beta fold hydrolase, partial [Bacteroidota bacterium]